MARDFLTSQIRTNQIIASRSLGSYPSLLIVSASDANGTGTVSPAPPQDSNIFLFVSGSRGNDAVTLFGGSVKVSGSLTVFDNVTLGDGSGDTINIAGRVGSNIVPNSTRTYDLGTGALLWSQVHSSTGSFEFLSVSQRGNFPSQISGSLQRTSAGLSYLVAGTGISISSASNGQITIAGTGAVSAAGSDTQIQFNDAGTLSGDDGLVYNKSTKTLSVGNIYVTGSITALTTSNLTISDPVIYLASGSSGPNVKSVIAFASGSTETDKSLIFGSIGANNILAAAKLDVQAGSISQSSLVFADLIPIRASKFEVGGTSAAVTSSDGQSLTLYSGGGGSIKIVPGSSGLILGNSGAVIAGSGSDVRFGNTSVAFGGEIPPQPGTDSYFFVSGSTMSLGTSTKGAAIFGGDVFVSGAFSQGRDNIVSGILAHAQGRSTIASGQYSHAEGFGSPTKGATGNYSHAEGVATLASGLYSHAEGNNTTASGEASHAEGDGTTASGKYSHAEGISTEATNDYSHAEGFDTTASGEASHAEGQFSLASGDYSHAEGRSTIAAANHSHAAGFSTIASGSYSYVGGQGTISSGSYQHIIGKYNTRNDNSSLFVIGNGLGDLDANRSDVFRVRSGTLGNGAVEVTGSLAITGILFASGSTYLGDGLGSETVYFNSSLGTDIVPDQDMQRNLGSASKRFANVYTGDLHLRNDRGDYTLIEESDCLTIRFNKTGKRYKFVLEPAPEYE